MYITKLVFLIYYTNIFNYLPEDNHIINTASKLTLSLSILFNNKIPRIISRSSQIIRGKIIKTETIIFSPLQNKAFLHVSL